MKALWMGLLLLAEGSAFAAAIPDATIRFESGSSKLDKASEKTLDELGRAFRERGVEKLLLVGHTDKQGKAAANRTLSLSRAKAVRAILVAQGIPEKSITVEGAGSTQLLDTSESKDADALNRRVELWAGAVKAGEDVAKVTWIHQRVEARKAITVDWFPAELMMPLRRKSEVRTVEDGAGELTFADTSRLYIGGESLVMIFDDAGATKKTKARIADVRLEEGAVFARLAEKERRALGITSPAAEHNVNTKSARLGYGKKKRASTIAVYEGKAEVIAKGQTVAVKEGYGTRTKVGEPPEPPTPLPPPPDWRTGDVLIAVGTSSVSFAWLNKAETASVAIEVAALDDTNFERPLKTWTVGGDTVVIKGPPVGAYRVRLSSMDKRGLVGRPGEPRSLIVMANAIDDDGSKVMSKNGKISLAKTGGLRFVAPRGIAVLASADGSAGSSEHVVLATETDHAVELSFRTENGLGLGRARVPVTIGAPEIVLQSVRAGSFRQWATTEVRFRVETKDGAPVSGLRFFGYYDGGASAPEQLSLSGGKTRLRLSSGAKEPNGIAGAAVELEPGQYVYHHDEVQTLSDREEVVTLYDSRSRFLSGVRFPVQGKKVAALEEELRPDWVELFAQARGGIEIQRPGGIRPILGVDLGADFTLSGPVHLDLSIGTGWVRREAGPKGADVNAHVVPFELRLALAYRGEHFGAYAGGLAGVGFVRLIDAPAMSDNQWFQTRAGGLLGLAYRFGVPSLFVEGQWTESGVKRTGDGLGSGPAVFAGIRLSSAP
jgi:hypothetical protein